MPVICFDKGSSCCEVGGTVVEVVVVVEVGGTVVEVVVVEVGGTVVVVVEVVEVWNCSSSSSSCSWWNCSSRPADADELKVQNLLDLDSSDQFPSASPVLQ